MAEVLHINTEKCCGCEACVQACPKSAITFNADKEGFFFPHIKSDLCIKCGLCAKACPVITTRQSSKNDIRCYAAKSPNVPSLEMSSSGAVFPSLAKSILEAHGVVFGAAYNKTFDVQHKHVDSEEGLRSLCESKYVQSRIHTSYIDTKALLQKGVPILFVGTPCQIAGLKSFLGKEYDNLYTVDFICHGVPSPGIWRNYLQELEQKHQASVANVSFRNKKNGWKNYEFRVLFDDKTEYRIIHYNDPYMKGFLHNFYLRASCHNCMFKNHNSGSDLTLGDYWRVRSDYPKFYSPMGVSIALAKTDKGDKLLKSADLDIMQIQYAQVTRSNRSLEQATPCPENRNSFWDAYYSSNSVSQTMNRLVPDEDRRHSVKSLVGDVLYLIRRVL